MKVDVKNLGVPYEYSPTGAPLFYVEETVLSYEQYDGEMSSKITRVNFERGDGVGVLPYIEETGEVILVELTCPHLCVHIQS
jgi:hypothetical protein